MQLWRSCHCAFIIHTYAWFALISHMYIFSHIDNIISKVPYKTCYLLYLITLLAYRSERSLEVIQPSLLSSSLLSYMCGTGSEKWVPSWLACGFPFDRTCILEIWWLASCWLSLLLGSTWGSNHLHVNLKIRPISYSSLIIGYYSELLHIGTTRGMMEKIKWCWKSDSWKFGHFQGLICDNIYSQ